MRDPEATTNIDAALARISDLECELEAARAEATAWHAKWKEADIVLYELRAELAQARETLRNFSFGQETYDAMKAERDRLKEQVKSLHDDKARILRERAYALNDDTLIIRREIQARETAEAELARLREDVERARFSAYVEWSSLSGCDPRRPMFRRIDAMLQAALTDSEANHSAQLSAIERGHRPK